MNPKLPTLQVSVEQMAALGKVVEAAENVVAQWRGDISRKPHIGRLRDALAALRTTSAKKDGP